LLNFIIFGKGVTIRMNIGRKISRDKENGMIMGSMGRGNSFWFVKNILVFGEKRLDVRMNCRGGGLNGLNGME
jgi:hypothetical protein